MYTKRTDQYMGEHKKFHKSEDFALDILGYKKNGYYVEMGSADPIINNTTYKMEKEYGWKGLGFDLDQQHVDNYNSVRSNPCLLQDATKFDYRKYFQENDFPKQIDYLQVDIESPMDVAGRPFQNKGQPLLGLISLPLTEYRFSVISFEHEYLLYYKNKSLRDAQREILDYLGYSLVVRIGHEDWWVDSTVIPYEKWKEYIVYASA